MLKRRPPNDSANRTVLYQSPQPETPPGAAPRANGAAASPTTAAPSAASLQGPLSDPWQSPPTTTTTIDAPPPTGSASARWIQPVPGAPLSPDELAAAFEPGPVPVPPPQPPVAAAPEAPTASVADAPAPADPAAPAPAAPTAPGASTGGGLDTSVRLVRVALARLVDDAGLDQGRDRHDTAGDEPDPAASAFEVVAADLAEEARRRAATEAARLRAEADAAVRDRLRAADLEAEAAVTAERDRLASVQADLRRIEAGVRAVAEPAAQALAGIGTGTARVRSAVAGALDQLERQERADRAERVAARVTVPVTEPDPPPEVGGGPTAVEDTEPTADGPTAVDPTAPTSAWRPGHFGR